MKLTVCAIRDSAVDAYMRPFFVPSTAVAVRIFRDEVLRPESEMFKHPEDYTLWELGAFEEESGVFEQFSQQRQLLRGQDVKEVVNAPVKA